MDGLVNGYVDGLEDGRAGLRIAYSNQKCITYYDLINFLVLTISKSNQISVNIANFVLKLYFFKSFFALRAACFGAFLNTLVLRNSMLRNGIIFNCCKQSLNRLFHPSIHSFIHPPIHYSINFSCSFAHKCSNFQIAA